ncbi:MAG TPA: hypothetical protein VHY37_09605 [Tepidisphaeraceae bacterium]|jgi:hypothetical protein|nr:hypothetical protein [Tepidisphaeraceae bacterium]
MEHQDEEISDVVVVLECQTEAEVNGAVEKLKALGMTVDEIDYENAVVEGNIEADLVKKLHAVPSVKHVRSVFSYTADFPPGDSRDKDGPEPEADADEE